MNISPTKINSSMIELGKANHAYMTKNKLGYDLHNLIQNVDFLNQLDIDSYLADKEIYRQAYLLCLSDMIKLDNPSKLTRYKIKDIYLAAAIDWIERGGDMDVYLSQKIRKE